MKIGKIIKEERTKRGLTQEDLAKELFITRQLVSKWENGKSYPDLDQVVKLSDWFELPLDYLLKEDTKMLHDLNFDGQLKKRLKIGAVIFSILTSGIILGVILLSIITSGPLLYKENITITKIDKVVLPQKIVTHPTTKETWTLPEDVEYLIHFKTTKPFANLDKLTGRRNAENDHLIQILLGGGSWRLWGGNKESAIYLYSQRENLENPSLNRNKDIYLMTKKKTSSTDSSKIESWSDKILCWDDLEKLPTTKKRLP